MKKSLILMCIGGMLALCTPLTAGEAVIDPPIAKHAIVKKTRESEVKSETTAPSEAKPEDSNNSAGNAGQRHVGGYVVISASALLLILILLILFL